MEGSRLVGHGEMGPSDSHAQRVSHTGLQSSVQARGPGSFEVSGQDEDISEPAAAQRQRLHCVGDLVMGRGRGRASARDYRVPGFRDWYDGAEGCLLHTVLSPCPPPLRLGSAHFCGGVRPVISASRNFFLWVA